jgi:hypothetical protein
MDGIVGIMKKVAQNEAQSVYTTELGIITAVFPHKDEEDKENYQCNVKLKNKKMPDGKDFELRKVPIASPYMGLVCIPNVEDLVIINFIGGDINAPVITGRLYNDKDRPPPNKEKEFLLKHDVKEGGSIKLDEEGKIIITSKNEKNIFTIEDEKISSENDKSSITIEQENITAKNEKASISIEQDDITVKNEKCTVKLTGSSINIDNGSCKLQIEGGGITLDAGTNAINLKSAGGNIGIESTGGAISMKSAGGSIKIGDPTTTSVQIGGIVPGAPICDNDTLILSSHTHVGNLGAPCPVMVPIETVNSIQAKARINTKVG